MPLRVAVDGLSGIGRQVIVAALAGGFSDLFEIVHIEEPAGPEAVRRRLQRDTNYGRLPLTLEVHGRNLQIGERSILVSASDAGQPASWHDAGIDIVVVDGHEPDIPDRVASHRARGARKVVVAGSPGPGFKTVVFGLNDGTYDPDVHHVVGTGSAVLNAIALPASIIQKHFAIARGAFAIVHPLKHNQVLADGLGGSRLTSRAASHLIPDLDDRSSVELGEIEPVLGSKLFGSVVHAPVAPVGWMTLSVETERRFDLSNAQSAFAACAQSEQYMGLLGMTTDSLVSGDIAGDAHSVTISVSEMAMIGRAFLSLRGWFDAEWALACRTADLVALVCEAGVPGTA